MVDESLLRRKRRPQRLEAGQERVADMFSEADDDTFACMYLLRWLHGDGSMYSQANVKGGKCVAAPYPSVAVRDRGH